MSIYRQDREEADWARMEAKVELRFVNVLAKYIRTKPCRTGYPSHYKQIQFTHVEGVSDTMRPLQHSMRSDHHNSLSLRSRPTLLRSIHRE